MFEDRTDAGARLAEKLGEYRAVSSATGSQHLSVSAPAVVLGIPRGGVVVAAEVARELRLALDVVVATKVGAPGNPEFAVGAVAADGEVHTNPATALPADEVRRISGPAHAKALHEVSLFRAEQGPLDLEDRTVIVVDDGLATGLTALAAVGYVRRMGAEHVVLAVPVAPPDTVRRLSGYVDELVVLKTPAEFSAVGQFYRRFGQVEDAEVLTLLDRAAQRTIG